MEYFNLFTDENDIQEQTDVNNIQIYRTFLLWFNVYIRAIISILFIIFLFLRSKQLKGVANSKLEYNGTLTVRIIFLSSSALFDAFGILLGYVDNSYYIFLYDKQNWQLISLFTIVAYIYQTYVMSHEYKKKIPYMVYHLYFWVILAVNSLAAIIFGILLVFQAGDRGSIFNWIQAVIVLGLNVIQIFLFILKRHDVYGLQGLPFCTNGLVNIIPAANLDPNDMKQSMLKQSFLAGNLLKIEVKKAIIKENEQLIQLNITYQDQVTKTQKTKYDFQSFEQQLRKFMDQNPDLYQAFNEQKLPNFSEYFDDDWGRIKVLLQPIFKTLQRRTEFYNNFFYQFLDLPQNMISQIQQVLKEDDSENLLMENDTITKQINSDLYQAPKYNTHGQDIEKKKISKTEFVSPLKIKKKNLTREDMQFNQLESINDVEDEQEDQIQDYQNKKKKKKQISFADNDKISKISNNNMSLYQKRKVGPNENKSVFVASTNEIQPRNNSIESYESEMDSLQVNQNHENQNQKMEKQQSNSNNQFNTLYFNVNIKDFVTINDHFEFIICVNYADNPKKVWKLQKRYNEFEDLNKNLKKAIKVELPKLPGKKILMEEKDLRERKQDLEYYLNQLLNDKVYLCPTLLNFINVDKDENKIILNSLFENRDFKKFRVEKISNEPKIDKDETYTLYRFQIYCENQKVKVLEKRFKQFVELNDSIKIRYQNHKQNKPELYKDIQFPELPPKFLAFGFKTSTKQREEKLVEYLNALFQMPEIGQSYVFINFLQIPLQQQQIRSKQVSKENIKITNNVQQKTTSEENNYQNKSQDKPYQYNDELYQGEMVDSYKIDNLGPRFVKESQEEFNFFS